MFENYIKPILIFLAFMLFAFFCYGLTASASSLFDVTDESSPFYPEDIKDDTNINLPDYATDENGNVLINDDTTFNDIVNPDPTENDVILSVSGNDLASTENIITYSDVEAIVTEALEDTRAANLSVADAYLTSAIVDVFTRVVNGYPSYYKYAAYRLNTTDANDGYMIIGSKANINGNYLEFSSGANLLHYYRTSYTINYQTYYNYKYDVSTTYDTYRIPFGTGQLLYTNMVKGYPTLSEYTQNYFASLVIPIFMAVIAFVIILRRKK